MGDRHLREVSLGAARRVPLRTCVGCRRQRPQRELERIARTPEGSVRYDPDGRLPGRGAYVCPDPRCIDAAARRDGHAVRRALRGSPRSTTTPPPPSSEVIAALKRLRTDVREPTSDDPEPPSASKERQA